MVTGSECTGKTTLAQRQLAAHLTAPWLPETARAYAVERLREGQVLTAADVEPIARRVVAAEDVALAAAPPILVLDTDLISTIVYARHYYGTCPAWIEAEARLRRGTHYLLCDPDPAVAGRRRARPAGRAHGDPHAVPRGPRGVRSLGHRRLWTRQRARPGRRRRRRGGGRGSHRAMMEPTMPLAISGEFSAGVLEAAITAALAVLCTSIWRRTQQPYFGWWALAFGLFLLRIARDRGVHRDGHARVALLAPGGHRVDGARAALGRGRVRARRHVEAPLLVHSSPSRRSGATSR